MQPVSCMSHEDLLLPALDSLKVCEDTSSVPTSFDELRQRTYCSLNQSTRRETDWVFGGGSSAGQTVPSAVPLNDFIPKLYVPGRGVPGQATVHPLWETLSSGSIPSSESSQASGRYDPDAGRPSYPDR